MRNPKIRRWPNDLIIIQDVEVAFERPAFEGPQPLIGRPQVVTSPAAGWRITYHGALAHRGNVQAFRAMLARHRGRALPIYVSPYDYLNGPVRRAGIRGTTRFGFVGGYQFTGGHSFLASIQDCTLVSAASEGDTEIRVNNSTMAPLSAGDYFELNERLHLVEDIIGSKWKTWPPLRADYAGGTVLQIRDPRMRAYLDISDSQALRLQYGHWGQLSLSFIEAGW
jgi:hypothetical protein